MTRCLYPCNRKRFCRGLRISISDARTTSLRRVFWTALLLLCAAAGMAQQGPAPAPGPLVRGNSSALGYPYVATYRNLYCAGFITRQEYPAGNVVVGGRSSPDVSRFDQGETVFLKGTGYQPGQRYAVIRWVRDPNRYEAFGGQHRKIDRLGRLYAEIGHVTVLSLEKEYAVAVISANCEPVVQGDTVVPVIDKGSLTVTPRTTPFVAFGVPVPEKHGRIVMSSDFDYAFGPHKSVYIDMGSNAGLHPGDYLRISRTYDPKAMSEVSRAGLASPRDDDTQRKPMKTPRAAMRNWPVRGIGEVVVISVQPDSATAMVTMSTEDVQLNDIVAPETVR